MSSRQATNDVYYLAVYKDVTGVNDFIVKQLKTLIVRAKAGNLYCRRVSLPMDLLPRIAWDILDKAFKENTGLRGCKLHISVENCDTFMPLGYVKFDPTVITSYNIHVVLTEYLYEDPWYNTLSKCFCPGSRNLRNTVFLKNEYFIAVEKK